MFLNGKHNYCKIFIFVFFICTLSICFAESKHSTKHSPKIVPASSVHSKTKHLVHSRNINKIKTVSTNKTPVIDKKKINIVNKNTSRVKKITPVTHKKNKVITSHAILTKPTSLKTQHGVTHIKKNRSTASNAP